MAGADLGGGSRPGGQQLQNGTGGGPHSQMPWVMHSPVTGARDGNDWFFLLLLVLIMADRIQTNPLQDDRLHPQDCGSLEHR